MEFEVVRKFFDTSLVPGESACNIGSNRTYNDLRANSACLNYRY